MSKRLTLQDLVDLLSDKQNVTKKDAEAFLRELVALISETIEQKDFVRIKDFGTFKLTPVSARKSVDVNTGEPIEIRAHYKLSFTPDKLLREGVNRPFSHFESVLLEDEVTFEDKDKFVAKPAAKPAEKTKVEPKVAEPKKTVVQPKETPKAEPVAKTEVVKDEEKVVETKIEEVTPEKTAVAVEAEKELLTLNDVKAEEELTDLNAFVAKEEVVEKVVEQPKSEPKKEAPVPPTPKKLARKYDDDDDDDFVDYEYMAQQKKKRSMWVGIGITILVLCVGGIFGYNYYVDNQPDVIPYAQNNANVIIIDNKKPEQPAVEPTLPSVTDELANKPEDKPVVAPDPVIEPEVVQPVAKPTAGSREIEVKSGQTMRVLGQEYYGHSAFWVYIFEENRDKIATPDAVFAGMKLTIPPASKYDIDPEDKASVRKAQRQELKLFGEFSAK